MSLYYKQRLEAKIERQKKEITRLLAENAELKGLNSTICDVCKNDKCLKETAEQARAEGQEEAWKLAQKLVLYERDGGFSIDELEEIFETQYWTDAFLLPYSEAAAKVAGWERKKEEICVGDVVSIRNANICGVVTYKDTTDNTMDVMTPTEGTVFVKKEDCTKTGRHINVSKWLEQIGESNA